MKLRKSIMRALSVPLLFSVGIGAAEFTPSSLSYSLTPLDAPADQTAVLYNGSAAEVSYSVQAIRLTQQPIVVTQSVVGTFSAPAVNTQRLYNQADYENVDFVPGEVIVSIKQNMGINAAGAFGALAQLAIEDMQDITPPQPAGINLMSSTQKQLVVVTLLDKSKDAVLDAIDLLKNDDNYEFAEPNWILTEDRTPNDAAYTQLWGQHNTGQTGGTADADIDAPEAWDTETGKETTVVGIIDTGIDYLHPDLVDNMWSNPGEIPGNGIDDDGNGFIDDIHGWDFVNNDNDPMDDRGHGTHVAGTIAGQGNDGAGIVGVMWDAQLVGLKFLSAAGTGSTSNAIKCVNYATMMNIPITNNSWGGGGYSLALENAIAAGQLFIAAAGNSGVDADISAHYPSSYTLDNIISVAATDHNDLKAGFSNWGLTSVDLAAPGVSIYSSIPGGGYARYQGTSMAAPQVAGAAGLIYSLNPSLTPIEIKALLLDNVDANASMDGRCVTGGRMNIANSLAATEPNWITVSDNGTGVIFPDQSIEFTVTVDPAQLAVGTWSADIVIATTDPTTPEVILPVTVEITGCKTLTLSAASITYPITWIGDNVTQAISLTNSCNEDVTISAITTSDADFTSQLVAPVIVPAYESVSLPVTFAPLDEKIYAETITIESDAQNNPVLTADLNAEGQYGPQIVVSPTSINETMATQVSRDVIISISNPGSRDLVVELSKSLAAYWLAIPYQPYTIVPGATEDITVTLSAPSLGGTYNADISISNNAVGGVPVVVPVSLTATADNFLTTTQTLIDWGVVTQPTTPTFISEPVGTIDVSSRKTVYADLDNDGDLDIIYAYSISSQNYKSDIVWFENSDNCSGTYIQRTINIGTATYWEPHDITTGDIDNDGDIDVVAIMGDRSGHSDVFIYRNDGNENFEVVEIDTDGYPTDVIVKDNDGDGDNDLMVSKAQDHIIEFYQNDGAGNFTMQVVPVPGTDQQYDIQMVDLDLDGDLDFVSTDYNSSTGNRTLVWYENSGSYSLVEHDILSMSSYTPASIGDIDGDGDLDISVAPWSDGLILLENTGGAFTQHTVSSARSDQWSQIIDVDGDGIKDILSATENGDGNAFPTLFKNDGAFNFTAIELHDQRSFLVHAADFNGDSDVDIVMYDNATKALHVLNNQTAQNQILTLENSGGSPTTISSFNISNSLFSINKTAPVEVPPLSTVCYEMTYTGTGAAYESGSITIVSNAIDNSLLTIDLTAGIEQETDVAFNKTASASSVEPGHSAQRAFDGDNSTRWSSDFSDPQWIAVDLYGSFDISRIVLDWETAAGKVYDIQTSEDGINWSTIFTETNGNGGIDEITVSATNVRHIRMFGTQRATEWGYSLFAFEAYGLPHRVIPPVLTTINLTPNPVTLYVGDTQLFTVEALDQFGNPFATTVTWSGMPGGAFVAEGVFLAMTAGTYDITATSGSVVGTTSVTILAQPVVTTVTITPNPITIAVGQTQQLSAETLDQYGNPIVATVSWTGMPGATITQAGVISGNVAGTGTIRATAGSVFGEASVTVVDAPIVTTITITPNPITIAVGQTQQLSAEALDQFGNPITATISWTGMPGATITQAGVISGNVAGTGTIRATAGSVFGEADVTVTQLPTDIAQGKTATASSTESGYPASNAVDGNSTTRWASDFSDPEWIQVDLAGAFDITSVKLSWETASAKNYQIQGSVNGSSWNTIKAVTNANGGIDEHTISAENVNFVRILGTARNTVWGYSLFSLEVYGVPHISEPPVLTSFAISPAGSQIVAGQSQLFSAQGYDQYGNPIASNITWATTAPATIDANGLFTSTVTGSYDVSATDGFVSGVTSITVTEVLQLTTIEISPLNTTVNVGETVQYSAQGLDQFGNAISATFAWMVIGDGGTVDANGLFTATAASTTTQIRVNSASIDATTEITITEVTEVNLLSNGDFSAGLNNWVLNPYEGGSAYAYSANNNCVIDIANGGWENWHIQFRQLHIPLENGKTYRMSFDAKATSNRSIDAQLETDGSPWTNYGNIPTTAITTVMDNYSYEFTMQETDMDARIVFNVGNNGSDITLDNIKVVEVP